MRIRRFVETDVEGLINSISRNFMDIIHTSVKKENGIFLTLQLLVNRLDSLSKGKSIKEKTKNKSRNFLYFTAIIRFDSPSKRNRKKGRYQDERTGQEK